MKLDDCFAYKYKYSTNIEVIFNEQINLLCLISIPIKFQQAWLFTIIQLLIELID